MLQRKAIRRIAGAARAGAAGTLRAGALLADALLAGVLVAGSLACATPAAGPPPGVGSSCDGTWSIPTDGVAIVPFTGAVYGKTAGERRPLAGARFVVVAGAPHERLPFLAGADGRFQGKILMPTHATRECRDGVVKAGYVVGSVTLSVRAEGCEDVIVTVDARWQARDIELSCKEKK
jgi:hypothetical protein